MRDLRKKKAWFGLIVLTLVALAIPVSFAFAAGASQSKQTVPVERYDNGCNSAVGNKKAIGSATMEKTKSGSIIVHYEEGGATPGNTYYFYFYANTMGGSPVSCGVGFTAGKIKADPNGHFSKTYTVPASDVSGFNDFWAYACDCSNGDFAHSQSVHF